MATRIEIAQANLIQAVTDNVSILRKIADLTPSMVQRHALHAVIAAYDNLAWEWGEDQQQAGL
jgi:hypothetical protein